MSGTVKLDHLLWAAPDLDEGRALFAALSGVEPAIGGSHPGQGTRNALASLEDETYLEIIAPDPGQPLAGNLGGAIAATRRPGLVAFALRSTDLAGLAQRAQAAGVTTDGPHAMSRRTPAGATLSWSILYLGHPAFGGRLHFALDWGATPHPATVTPAGCRLTAFAVLRRDPAPLRSVYAALGAPITVAAGAEDGFMATIETPNGPLVLLHEAAAPGEG